MRVSTQGARIWLSSCGSAPERKGTELEWVVPQTYRKTVTTLTDRGDLSVRTIADQLGHSRISMTRSLCTVVGGCLSCGT
jgi:integrase